MLLKDIKNLLTCENLTNNDLLDREISYCHYADLMSDVLKYCKAGALLITALTNPQVIQVAELLDLKGIIFVKNKKPDNLTIKEAINRKIPLLLSPHSSYDTCGILYKNGLTSDDTYQKMKNGTTDSISTTI